MKRNYLFFSKIKLFLFIFLLSSLFMGQIAFAGNGDGTGSGSNAPLSLVFSSIKNGATGVSLKPQITLTFSKNIVNMTVKDNNLKCFSIKNENGTIVPIEVIFADDQVDFADRNNAVITPKSSLAQGTTYTIVVSSQLEAKSGALLGGNGITISFKTEGVKPAYNTSNSSAAIQKAGTPNTTTNTATAAPQTATSTAAKSTDVKPAADQAATDTHAKTDDNKTNTEQQLNVENRGNVPADTKVKAVKTKNHKTANTKNEMDKSQTDNNNTAMITTVISLIVILAAATAYLYIRRKLKK